MIKYTIKEIKKILEGCKSVAEVIKVLELLKGFNYSKTDQLQISRMSLIYGYNLK